MQLIICILLSARSLGRCYMLSGVWITAVSDNIDRPLSRVLYNILGIPQCVSGIAELNKCLLKQRKST